MKALLIDPATQSIEAIDIAGMDDIKAIIGYDTIESDAIGNDGDRLYFDEECFIRGTEGRFQIDSVIPVAGKGIIIGVGPDDALLDAKTTSEGLHGRIKFQ